MTADQFVRQYHAIQVPQYKVQNGKVSAVGMLKTPVDEYLNKRHTNRAGYSHDQRWKFRKGIWDFIEKHAKMSDTPVYPSGTGVIIENSISSCPYVDNAMMKKAFYGKAAPGVLQQVIHAMSYWRAWREQEPGMPVPSLADLVDMFLGSDCNGFVGNYMSEKYKAYDFKLGDSSPEEDFFYNRQEIRDSGVDLRADDIVLLNRTADPKKGEVAVDWSKKSKKDMEKELSTRRFNIGHIMVISSVGGATQDQAEVLISESATRHEVNGGPRTRPFTLKRIGLYRWKIVGRDREVHSIIKVKRTG